MSAKTSEPDLVGRLRDVASKPSGISVSLGTDDDPQKWARVDCALLTEAAEALLAAEAERDRLRGALEGARLQIEYLHQKFGQTGSGNAVLAQIDALSDTLGGADAPSA